MIWNNKGVYSVQKLDFEVKMTELCDCMMASLVNAAIYFERNYEYLFKPIWVFGYSNSKNTDEPFWKRLNTPLMEHPHDQLKKYHGIDLICNKGVSYNKFLDDVKNQIAIKKPVPIEFDAFHCPWAGVYHKAYLLHYSLVVGYNNACDILYCVDPYVTNKTVEFPIAELEKGFHHHYIFELTEPEMGTENWKADIRNLLQYKQIGEGGINSYDMIRLLARDIYHTTSFLEEMKKQNDFYTYELFYQLKYMTHSRLNYGMFLRYIMNKEHVFEIEPFIQDFNKTSALWRQVWLKFTKITYLNNYEKAPTIIDSIYHLMMQIADLEENMANALLIITQ